MPTIKYRAVNREPDFPAWLKDLQMPGATTQRGLDKDELIALAKIIDFDFWQHVTPNEFINLVSLVRRVEEHAYAAGESVGYDEGHAAGLKELEPKLKTARETGYDQGHAEGYAKGFEVGQDMKDD